MVDRLEYTTLRAADLSGSNLTRANLGGRGGKGISLKGVSLCGARLLEACLEGTILDGASLVGADLRGAHLRGASLVLADLVGANLREADLSGADLRGVAHAPDIRWPDGFIPSLVGVSSYEPVGIGSIVFVPMHVPIYYGDESPNRQRKMDICEPPPGVAAVVVGEGPDWFKIRLANGRSGFLIEPARESEAQDADSGSSSTPAT